ncbi:MAG: trypsin-like peptidase domain-containing protein [Verrucomicrobia bacterium]|nr:trypsin-like peptidase domain-containing protein [Verrucomicrobiota bacterium]
MKLPFRFLPFVAGLLFAVPAPLHAAPEADSKATAPLISGLDDLRQLDRKLVSMADRTAAATVSLMSANGGAAGSGVIVSKEGLILSAGHVSSAMTGDIVVLFADGKRAKAEPLGADFDRDAAMLRITDPGEYPFVEVAPADPLPTNAWCVALGHPGGYDPLRTPPLRLGRVLGYGEFLITDSTVVSGDSGGPLFDTEGRVIGIHSNIGATLGENRHVPIKVFRDQWDDLLAGKRTGKRFNQKAGEKKPNPEKKPEGDKPKASEPKPQPKLGLKLGAESEEGVTIDEVAPDSPAAKAGLQAKDVIVRIGARKVTTIAEFADALANRRPRPFVSLAYQRDGETKRLRIPFPPPNESKADEKPAPTADDELNAFIDKCLDEAKDGRAELKLTPDLIEKFGGMDRIQQRLKERLEQRKPGEMKAPEPKKGDEKAAKPEQPKDKPATGTEKETAAEKAKRDRIAKLMDRARSNGGRLEITPEDLADLGGMAELQKFLGAGQAAPDDFFLSVLKALKPVTRETSGATVTIRCDGKDVALGTVVSADGGILTKSSETAKGDITVSIGKKDYPATLVKRFADWDLALFAIPAKGLTPVKLDAKVPASTRGSLLAVPGTDGEPLGIGLVSVTNRPLGHIGFLGIESDRTVATGGRITAKSVTKDGPADKGGVKAGDSITAINGEPVSDPIGFTRTITRFKPGDVVKLDVQRGEEKLNLEVKLGERPTAKASGEFLKINKMSGPLSPKIDGFPLVLQHDIPLEPAQCGGPLVNLDGTCVGINVSRAGRVNTFAIPAANVAEILASAQSDLAAAIANAKPTPSEPAVSAEEIAEISKALDQIQQRLKRIEKQLQPAGSDK